jgi:hypothetical protein
VWSASRCHLDDVLSRIRQARLELQVPWDLRASQLVADCHRRAIECAEKARATISSTDREFFLDMERRWLFLARIYEFTDPLTWPDARASACGSEPAWP